MELHGPDEIAALIAAGQPVAEYSPFGDSPMLALDFHQDWPEGAAMGPFLSLFCCPLVGVGPVAGKASLAAACDVLVEDVARGASVLRRIVENPVASTVFVRLLRSIDGQPVPLGLEAESLAYATLQSGAEYARWLRASAPRPLPREDGPAIAMTRHERRLDVELNRPEARNSMSVEMRDALNEALSMVLVDHSIDQVDIRARGPCFSTGGELSEFGSVPDPASGHLVRALTVPGRLLDACANRARVTVHGACIGSGIEFPAFAGELVARPDAQFQLPEVGMGLIPGAGGCVSIARRIGRQRLAWLGLSGETIDARTALDWGLVDHILENDVDAS